MNFIVNQNYNDYQFAQDTINLLQPILLDTSLAERTPLEILECTMNDIRPEAKDSFINKFIEIYKKNTRESSIRRSAENIKKMLGENYLLDKMNDSAKNRFEDYLVNFTEKSANSLLEALNEGASIRLACNKLRFHFKSPVFTILDFNEKLDGNLFKGAMNQLQRRAQLREELNLKRLYKEREVNFDKSKLQEETKRLAFKTIARLVSENINIIELDSENRFKLITKYTQVIFDEENAKAKEQESKALAQSQQALEELLLEERKEKKQNQRAPKKKAQNINNPKKSSSTTTTTTTSTSTTTITTTTTAPTGQPKQQKTVAPIETERDVLNKMLRSRKSIYSLHPRICRWNVSNWTQIKGFTDRDKDGNTIKHYEHLGEPEILFQQAYHNLSGIEYLVSNDKLSEKYSITYPLKTNSNRPGIGKCFYSVMNYQGNKKVGLIHVGIGDDRVVFHAKFSPLREEQELGVKEIFQVIESTEVAPNDSWKQVTACSLEILQDDTLLMKVKKLDVHFVIHPVKS